MQLHSGCVGTLLNVSAGSSLRTENKEKERDRCDATTAFRSGRDVKGRETAPFGADWTPAFTQVVMAVCGTAHTASRIK